MVPLKTMDYLGNVEKTNLLARAQEEVVQMESEIGSSYKSLRGVFRYANKEHEDILCTEIWISGNNEKITKY